MVELIFIPAFYQKYLASPKLNRLNSNDQVILQTEKWIKDVVIGCNLCPFAAHVVNKKAVHYQVEDRISNNAWKETLLSEFIRLDNNSNIETSFIIFPSSFQQFNDYLDMLSEAEKLLRKNKYSGIYQIASFHPLYLFANTAETDASNYTNRSVYPMLHLLREESIETALKNYQNPELIPERNVEFTRKKGLNYMRMLRDMCL